MPTLAAPTRCLLALAVLVAAACGGDDDDATAPTVPSTSAPAPAPASTATTVTTLPTTVPTTTASAPAPPAPRTTAAPTPAPSARPAVRAARVADVQGALALAVRPGDDGLYLAHKGGRVTVVRGGRVDPTMVLDLGSEVSQGAEQGLLGLVFSPDGGHLYVNFTNRAGDTRIVEFAFRDGVGDPSSRRELLAVEQPFANHNGGNLVFGPDGYLYIGLGDGGSRGDPNNNGQRLDTLLGKMLRIDPRPGDGRPYSIPPGNPFTGRPGARPEIWAYGLRNPWRYSFDRGTGDLWIGDVGQNSREEVNRVPASSRGGENYGWNRFESRQRFSGQPPPDYVPPVYDYPLSGGNCAETGGYVYRGVRIPGLRGVYVFGDYCQGQLFGLFAEGDRFRAESLGIDVATLSSFGEDAAGELYVLSLTGGLFRLEAR